MSQGMIRQGLSGSLVRAAGALILLGLVGGCGGGEGEVEPSPTTQGTTVTPEPEPEPVEVLPEEPTSPVPPSGTPNEYDAEAAGEFFVRLYEYTLATADTEQWEERSLPGCEFCTNVIEDLAANEEQRARYTGVEFTIEPAQFVAFEDTLRMFAVEVPYETPDVFVVGPDDEVVRSYEGGPGFFVLELAYQPSTGWLLRSANGRGESIL